MNEDFQRDGYIVVRQLFSEDEIAQIKAEAKHILENDPPSNGVFVGMAIRSEIFKSLARDSRVLDILEPILGHNIEFLSDKVVFKSASVPFGSPWHQDWHYWHGKNKISLWIALDKATIENGCLKLLSGSHQSIATHDGSDVEGIGFGHRLKPGAIDEEKAFVATCEVGDVVVFHDLTLHSSFPNLSGQDRWSLISTYRSASEPDLQYDWAVAAAIVRGKPFSKI